MELSDFYFIPLSERDNLVGFDTFTNMKEKKPTAALLKAMNEAKTGKVTHAKNVTELLEKLKS